MSLSRERVFYVYALCDPRKPGPFRYGRWNFEYEPFYIGKGKGNRAMSHLNQKMISQGKGNTHKLNKIKKIQKAGQEPIVRVGVQNLTERQALLLEREAIACVGRADLKTGPLTNWSTGGEQSGVRAQRGPAVRKKMSEAQIKRFKDPKARAACISNSKERSDANPKAVAARVAAIRAPECRAKIADSVRKLHRDRPEIYEEARRKRMETVDTWSAKIRATMLAHPERNAATKRDPESWAAAISRGHGGYAISAFDKEGRKIGEYLTKASAARELRMDPWAIALHLRGERTFRNGYTFRRVAA